MTVYTTRYVRVEGDRQQRIRGLANMQIWLKLSLSLGTLAGLTILVVLINYLVNSDASQKIRNAEASALPAAAALGRAQSDVVRMSSDLHIFLLTGQQAYRASYAGSAAAMTADLVALANVSGDFTGADQQRLNDLRLAFDRWNKLPDRFFALDFQDRDRVLQNLDLFQTEAAPLAGQMVTLLDQIAASRQSAVGNELSRSTDRLAAARWATLAVGLVTILCSLSLLFFLRASIGGPIRRLTHVAEQVRTGDLGAQAVVDSHDEIGALAETFNRMTRHLRRMLFQSNREKKRADNLLNVVIPIGVQLTAERDFDRLLETIVLQAKNFCHANCGVLYLRSDATHLQPIVLRDDAAGLALGGTTGQPIPYDPIPLDDPMHSLTVRAAWFNTTVNVPDAVPTGATNYISPAFADDPYANNTSFLAIPLKPSQGQVMGVLQLTGAQDPDTGQLVPFDSHLQQMMDSLGLLAAAALEGYLRERGLKEQIQQLRIEIDEIKRQQQVKDIVETDFFQNLQAKARTVRERSGRSEQTKPQATGDAPA